MRRDRAGERFLRLRSYHRLYLCRNCRHRWRTPPILTDTALTDQYELEQGLVRYGDFTASPNGALPSHLTARLELLAPGTVLLDFGSGDGSFLSAARERGIDAWGVDSDLEKIDSHPLGAFIRERIHAFPENSFDAIHAHHVMEHVEDPVAVLGALAGRLKAGGLFMVEVPNEFESLAAILKQRLGRKSCGATSLYEHQHFYSQTSLQQALAKSGLSSRSPQTPRRIMNGLRGRLDYIAALFKRGDVIYTVAGHANASHRPGLPRIRDSKRTP
jgi:2-polyprenyl-3-methyl-5-hydroxy-6-metoxy-1,4-benzoquinol methylase